MQITEDNFLSYLQPVIQDPGNLCLRIQHRDYLRFFQSLTPSEKKLMTTRTWLEEDQVTHRHLIG